MKKLTYQAIPMTTADIPFVIQVLTSPRNKSALNPSNLSLAEWQTAFEQNLTDPDEANFIIRQGETPVAWLKLNGLQGSDMAWISMLGVHENHQRQGVGSFAIRTAEDYAKANGFTAMGIHANVENTPAVNCYKNAGYIITEEGDCTNGDGSQHRGYTFYKDHLDAVRMCMDGVYFRVGEAHDFSFLSELGKVFRVFDATDSGNICFGVERDGKRYFVKYAGARTMDYKGEIADAVARLKAAVKGYEDLQHPALIRLVRHFPVGDGYAAVFEWVDGEGFFSYWDYSPWEMKNNPQSPNARFRHLPIEKRIAVVDKIFDFHRYATSCGYVPVDFYDGSLLYDFARDELHICDIDFYRKAPVVNDMGKWWGSSRFLSPEEKTRGAAIDEVTTVYTMGAAAFVLLGSGGYDVDRSFASWHANKALFDVATKAVSDDRNERYQSMDELIAAWEQAKGVYTIEYKRLELSDLSPDMLKSFHRYKEVKKSWRNIDDEWVLIGNPYIEEWDDDFRNGLITEDFPQAIKSGGTLLGAYDDNKLIGFFALDGNLIGSEKQYAWLVYCHVSAEYRHHGIGRTLFNLAAKTARELGAPKMYISASSSEESQAFYRAVGCVHAQEIIPELFAEEPYDVHMEFALQARGVYTIAYKRLELSDLSPDMLKSFHRYQEIKKKWEKKDGEWVLIDSPHTLNNWDVTTIQQIVKKDFTESIQSGGCMWGAFDEEKLIGFCVISNNPIGSKEQYIQLRQMHVSYEYRGKGIGRKLFTLSLETMKNCVAKKLYIVANPSEESQAFYRAMGCVEAEEIIPELYDDSYDVHMEFAL